MHPAGESYISYLFKLLKNYLPSCASCFETHLHPRSFLELCLFLLMPAVFFALGVFLLLCCLLQVLYVHMEGKVVLFSLFQFEQDRTEVVLAGLIFKDVD